MDLYQLFKSRVYDGIREYLSTLPQQSPEPQTQAGANVGEVLDLTAPENAHILEELSFPDSEDNLFPADDPNEYAIPDYSGYDANVYEDAMNRDGIYDVSYDVLTEQQADAIAQARDAIRQEVPGVDITTPSYPTYFPMPHSDVDSDSPTMDWLAQFDTDGDDSGNGIDYTLQNVASVTVPSEQNMSSDSSQMDWLVNYDSEDNSSYNIDYNTTHTVLNNQSVSPDYSYLDELVPNNSLYHLDNSSLIIAENPVQESVAYANYPLSDGSVVSPSAPISEIEDETSDFDFLNNYKASDLSEQSEDVWTDFVQETSPTSNEIEYENVDNAIGNPASTEQPSDIDLSGVTLFSQPQEEQSSTANTLAGLSTPYTQSTSAVEDNTSSAVVAATTPSVANTIQDQQKKLIAQREAEERRKKDEANFMVKTGEWIQQNIFDRIADSIPIGFISKGIKMFGNMLTGLIKTIGHVFDGNWSDAKKTAMFWLRDTAVIGGAAVSIYGAGKQFNLWGKKSNGNSDKTLMIAGAATALVGGVASALLPDENETAKNQTATASTDTNAGLQTILNQTGTRNNDSTQSTAYQNINQNIMG